MGGCLLQQAQHLSCPTTGVQSGDLGSLRLRDAAATFLFAGSTSSKAEHPSQRHADKHSHRQGAAFDSMYLWDSHKHKHRQLSPPILGWQRQKVTCASTHSTLQVHKHTHIDGSLEYQHGPSVCLAPLPGSEPHHPSQGHGHWLLYSMLPSKHVALRFLSLMQSTFTSPFGLPAQTTTHFISRPGPGPPTCQLVQCEVLLTNYMCTPCTAGLGKKQMLILTPPGACTAVLLQLLVLSLTSCQQLFFGTCAFPFPVADGQGPHLLQLPALGLSY